MSYDFPFLLSLLITRRYPSLLFLKFVPVSHLYLDRPSRADGFSSYLEVDHRKWEPRGNEFFPTGFARFPILWIHVSCFLLVYHCHSFTSLSLLSDCPSSEKGIHRIFNSYLVTPSRVSLFISCSHFVDFLPCYLMAFCSDLASFPFSLSRRGIMLEELRSQDTGFCDCDGGGVGVSGPGVDGV